MSFSQLTAKFSENYEIYNDLRDFFPHIIMERLFKYFEIDKQEFVRLTHLDEAYYSRAMNKKHRFDIKTIITICVALDVDWPMTEFILDRYGYKLFDDQRLHFMYKFLIINRNEIKTSYEKLLKSEYRETMKASKHYNEETCNEEIRNIRCYDEMMVEACNFFLESIDIEKKDLLGTRNRKPNSKSYF